MSPKRARLQPRQDSSDGQDRKAKREPVIRAEVLGSIRSKVMRHETFERYKAQRKSSRKARRRATHELRERLGDEAADMIQEPLTIEKLAEPNPAELDLENDTVAEELSHNPDYLYFEQYRSGELEPMILITTNKGPRGKPIIKLVEDLMMIFPTNMKYVKRGHLCVKEVAAFGRENGFTHLVVVKEDGKKPNNIMVTELAHGPTANFRLVDFVLMETLTRKAKPLDVKSECFMNRFSSNAGRMTGLLLGSLFGKPNLTGRQIVTLHNQRDYVFFRAHRYVFEVTRPEGDDKRVTRDMRTDIRDVLDEDEDVDEQLAKSKVGARLQEIGPRLTLKLTWLQRGPFDPVRGEYFWIGRRDGDAIRDRKKFVM